MKTEKPDNLQASIRRLDSNRHIKQCQFLQVWLNTIKPQSVFF